MPISGPFSSNYKPKFSGHETFPLRYAWIPKITQNLQGTEKDYETTSQILNPDQIICNLEKSVQISIELNIEKGRGYVPAEDNKSISSELGVIFFLYELVDISDIFCIKLLHLAFGSGGGFSVACITDPI